jgi:MFS family permease
MRLLQQLFRSPEPVPEQYRANFFHLYMDIAWFGVLNGSILTFLAIFGARLGASATQLGLLAAAPAVVNLIFTLPAGIWVRRFSTKSATCWSSAISRLFYLFLIPLPSLLPAETQIWVIITIILVMNIPGTIAAVLGNAFFAEAVPAHWRGHVVGTRNALLAATAMLSTLACGQILERLPFPLGYQVVFGIGFIGAALSVMHIFFIKPIKEEEAEPQPEGLAQAQKPLVHKSLRLDVLFGPFGRVLILLFMYQFSVFIAMPIFPLYQVRVLQFSDQTISLGTSLFWIVHFFGSTQTGRLSRRISNQKMFAGGLLLTALSSLIFIFSFNLAIYTACQIVAGIGWSMIGGGVLNYLLERVPANDRPPYLSWYNLSINAAALLGALIGPLIAGQAGLIGAMVVVVVFRVLAGLAILQWGSNKQRAPVSVLPDAGPAA